MKLVRLVGYNTIPVEATVFVNKKTKMYFNLKHGGPRGFGKQWFAGLDHNFFKPKHKEDKLILKNDNYVLVPTLSAGGKIVKDFNGYPAYNIAIDDAAYHRNDLIVLWEIPNRNYKEVKTTIVGKGTIIASGTHVKIRKEGKYEVPAPVVEIMGDVKLIWEAKDQNDDSWKQIATYDYLDGTWENTGIEAIHE